jgi:hypothetical protein
MGKRYRITLEAEERRSLEQLLRPLVLFSVCQLPLSGFAAAQSICTIRAVEAPSAGIADRLAR